MPLDPRDDKLPQFVDRVQRLADAHGLKVDPVAMALRLVQGPLPILRMSPDLYDDTAVLRPMQSFLDADTRVTAKPARINPAHEQWRGILPDGLLEEVHGLDLSSAARRAELLRKWEADGTIRGKRPGTPDALITELSAKDPARLTPVERITLDRAKNGLVQKAQPEKPLTRDQLPRQFRTLQGRALIDAEMFTRQADRARAAIAAHETGRKLLGDTELHRAREALVQGGGGSVR